VADWKYLVTTRTNQNCFHEGLNKGLSFWKPSYDSDTFVSKHATYKLENRNLPFVLYCCKTLSVTLREQNGVGEFENRMLRRLLALKWEKKMGRQRKLCNV
jgi:hypothetical protein